LPVAGLLPEGLPAAGPPATCGLRAEGLPVGVGEPVAGPTPGGPRADGPRPVGPTPDGPRSDWLGIGELPKEVLIIVGVIPVMAVELLAATSGLGFLIMQAGDYLNTALVFAGISTIALTGLILDTGLRGLLMLADPSRRG
jgi:hypothetical protein